jgi:hypothetical protein
MPNEKPLLGAYLLPGDTTWLHSSLSRYYPLLDDLVVLVPERGESWTGARLPVEDCLRIIKKVDVRGLVRVVSGHWTDPAHPRRAEIAQRQRGVDALGEMDWVLQIDNDELLPEPSALLECLKIAEDNEIPAMEWPMRVLFRALGNGRFLEVVSANGDPRFDYPGPIAIRPRETLVDCRRTSGGFLRPVVVGDQQSLQLTRAPAENETRADCLLPSQAILHNSWGRHPESIRRKLRSTAHQEGSKMFLYYWGVWQPAPLTWRWLRNFHLLYGPLWPRLAVLDVPLANLVLDEDSG